MSSGPTRRDDLHAGALPWWRRSPLGSALLAALHLAAAKATGGLVGAALAVLQRLDDEALILDDRRTRQVPAADLTDVND